MTAEVSAWIHARLDRLMRHANEVIARRRRGVDQAPTKDEAERRERSLQRFIKQVARERDALHDRLERQRQHAALLQARTSSKRSPRREFNKGFRGPMR
jgi:HAMP domain-containing protein